MASGSMDPGTCVSLGGCVGLCGYMWRSDVVEVLGGTRESHKGHRFIHHSSLIKLTRALPPIQQDSTSDPHHNHRYIVYCDSRHE
jgi:hypothetical protein